MDEDEYFRITQGINLDILEIYGSSYVIEFYLTMRKLEQEQELTYLYISECLRNINTSIAKRFNGSYFSKSLYETKKTSLKPPEKKSARKIIADINKKARLVVTD